jgi:CBS domain-containing protein
MGQIRSIMTPSPVALAADVPVLKAAEEMRGRNIGNVFVMEGDRICGIVTDRDIVVRVLAEGKDPGRTKLGEICSRDLVSVAPDDPVDKAVQLVREKAIRRLPVLEDGQPVGVVTIGDLAVEKDPKSALADVSTAGSNR